MKMMHFPRRVSDGNNYTNLWPQHQNITTWATFHKRSRFKTKLYSLFLCNVNIRRPIAWKFIVFMSCLTRKYIGRLNASKHITKWKSYVSVDKKQRYQIKQMVTEVKISQMIHQFYYELRMYNSYVSRLWIVCML